MMRFASVLAAVVIPAGAVLVAPGCGLVSSPKQPDSTLARSPVGVEVKSNNWNDITVYLITAGLPQRLGMVTAMGNASFEFPAQRLNTSGSVRLRALPVAGHAFTSETILVMPGQVITWRLENDLDISSLSVY
jgi:hypothetical protein